MQLKAGVPLKGNLKSAECEENLREPEKPAHKSACNDWGESSQTALKSAKLPQLLQLGLQLGLHMCSHSTVAASTSMVSAHAMQKCCIQTIPSIAFEACCHALTDRLTRKGMACTCLFQASHLHCKLLVRAYSGRDKFSDNNMAAV